MHYNGLSFGHNPEPSDPPHLKDEHLCNLCQEIILKDYPNHESVPFILKNLADRGLKREDNPEYRKTV